MRLFFALWPDEKTAERLASAASDLALKAIPRPVPAKNYHLTLAFLGEVAQSRLVALRQVGRAHRAPCCSIEFNALEFWPKSAVIVATAQNIPAALVGLRTHLQKQLALPLEPQWRPHITLARKVAQATGRQAMSPIVWRANSFSLIRSETGGTESAYTVVDTWPLLDET
jgi:2'-5' RNA ligase